MIEKFFKFCRKSKEQQIAKTAMKLINLCNEIGRIKASDGDAAAVTIYEFSHEPDKLEINCGWRNNIEIKFNHKGKIIK